jgi:hypothetical protein
MITIYFSSQDAFSLTDQASKEYQIVAHDKCGTTHYFRLFFPFHSSFLVRDSLVGMFNPRHRVVALEIVVGPIVPLSDTKVQDAGNEASGSNRAERHLG